MGLNTTHNAYHGSYGGFKSMRQEIAKLIGFNLPDMIGFGGNVSWNTIKHPIKPLLNHSDCDGELSVKEQISIIKGIDLLLPIKKDNIFLDNFLITFKEGCELASSNNEIIKFR